MLGPPRKEVEVGFLLGLKLSFKLEITLIPEILER